MPSPDNLPRAISTILLLMDGGIHTQEFHPRLTCLPRRLKYLRSPTATCQVVKNTAYSSPEKIGVPGSVPSLAAAFQGSNENKRASVYMRCGKNLLCDPHHLTEVYRAFRNLTLASPDNATNAPSFRVCIVLIQQLGISSKSKID
jgi:hypothetical protein